MRALEALRIGLREIAAFKLRSFLTFFGIAVGTASVVSMAGVLQGWKSKAETQLRNSGPGRLIVLHSKEREARGSLGLQAEDAEALRAALPSLRVVSPVFASNIPVRFKGRKARAGVTGATPAFRDVDWRYRLRGRFITDGDVATAARVCLAIKPRQRSDFWKQDDPLERAFRGEDPLGQTLVIGITAFRVVGVLEEQESERLLDLDFGQSNILVPLSSYRDRLLPRRPLHRIDLDTGDPASVALAEHRVRRLLTLRHRGIEDFEIKNFAKMMEGGVGWVRTAGWVLGAIAAIALFAGGVGIMNVTLASISTRVREIGIRKALGAGDDDILLQFLVEAGLLSAAGGLVGCALGVGACRLGRRVLPATGLPTPPYLAAALAMALGVGLLFALYPAWQAARTEPAGALRYE